VTVLGPARRDEEVGLMENITMTNTAPINRVRFAFPNAVNDVALLRSWSPPV
jgi:hypothetical protein